MTISSALVAFATADQRQFSPVEATEAVTSDAIPALQAGPWSAIDWEFGSVLQALMPDGKDEPVPAATAKEKTADLSEPVVQAAAPQPLTGLPQSLPANVLLAFARANAQVFADEPEPAAPDVAVAVEAADSVKTVVAETVRLIPRLAARVQPAPKDTAKSAPEAPAKTIAPTPRPTVARAKDNYLEAQVVTTTAVRTSDIATLLPTPLPQGVDSQPPDAKTNAAPPTENTLDAEVVDAPAIRPFDIVPAPLPRPLPPDIVVEKNSPVRVKENTFVASKPLPVIVDTDTAPGPTSEIVPPLSPEPLPVQVRADAEPASTTPATPETAAKPLVMLKPPRPAVHTEKTPVRATPRREQRTEDAAEPSNNVATPEVEPKAPTIPVPAASSAPVEAVQIETADAPLPAVREDSEDEPAPAPALMNAIEKPSPSPLPSPIPNATAPAPQETAPRPIGPEKRKDDSPKSQPAGLTVVAESRPERGPVEISADKSPAPADKQTVDLGHPAVLESKGKSDQLSPDDTEIAFTGRLVPRKAAEETAPRPDSVEPKLEKLTGTPTREVREAPVERPVERQVAPPADGDRERPTLKTEPASIVPAFHRDTPVAASVHRPADAPPEAPSAARTSSREIIPEPVKQESTGPVREISMRFNDPSQDSAHLRVVDKGGEVLVSVRSGSEQLARTLSSDLGDLAHRLEQSGFQSELFRPSAASSSGDSANDRRDSNASTADPNANQSWSRERRDSQGHPGRQAQEWVDDLEESMGLSQ